RPLYTIQGSVGTRTLSTLRAYSRRGVAIGEGQRTAVTLMNDLTAVARATESGSNIVDIRLNAVVENYRLCQRLSGTTVGAVVKADGYGLGAIPIARAIREGAHCDTFFVARLEEGVALRYALLNVRIFVLDGCPGDTASALIAHNLTPILNSLQQIAAWRAAARARRGQLDGVLNLDTRM